MYKKTRGRPLFTSWATVAGLFMLGLLYSISSAFAQAADAVCAEVKIVIEQKLSLERQAFDAKMVITNGLADQKLENVSIELKFLDANNNLVIATSDPNAQGATFFYRTDQVTGITNLQNGVIAPKAVANINWLIIPAAGSGGSNPQGAVYYVGAKVSYTLDGKADSVEVAPESIVVRPQPELVLDYFLPRDVHADDPFTPETEAAEPFTLGVRIKNQGAGASHKTKIDTAQPRIVENRQGLAISFQILGGYVGDQPAGKSLLLDFGDIESGISKMGRWSMVTSLSGKFVEFSASFTHADSLGGAVTSLIKEVRTHTLIQDVRVDLPGRDKVRDFLAKDGDVYRVYESDGADTEVQNQTVSAQMTVQGNNASLRFSPVAQGFAYARVTDPSRGAKLPLQVTRADGYIVPAENVWLSKERNEDLSWSYFLNIFDANTSGQYSIGFVAGSAEASIAGLVYQDRNSNGMRDAGEPGIPVTEVKLSGTQASTGATELQTAYTDAQGAFNFTNLKPGVYSLTAGVADGLVDGSALAGSAGGQSEAGKFSSIELTAGTAASGYLFAKRSATPDNPNPEPKADLAVAAGATPATVKRGEKSSVTITAENLGPASAVATTVNVELPAGLTVLSQSAAVGSYANGVWTLGDMATRSTAILTLDVQTAKDGSAKEFAVAARIGSSTKDDISSNNSASTLIRIQDSEAVTATQTADQGVRLLAYIGCGADQACAAQKRQTAQTVLAAYDDEAEIVETAAAFQKALRAGDFSILWLSGSLGDLSANLQEEVRAAVLRGASLVVDGAADTHLRAIADMWGGYADQPLASAALQLGANALPLTSPSWALATDAPATSELRYATGETAAARTSYGKGQVLAMGFDSLAEQLSGTEWTAWLQAQMALSTPKLADPMLAQSSVYLNTIIKNGDDKARQLTLSTALANGAQLLSSKPAAAVNGDQLRWPMDLATGAEQGVELWLQLPADAKAFSLESQLRNTADAVVVESWSHSLRTIAQPQAEANARAAVPAIAGLSDADKAALMALFDQATAAAEQQKLGDAITALVQAQQQLRALPQGAGRDAALQAVAQWIGLVSATWKEDGSATKNWTLSISSGNQQVAQVGTAFAAPLQVRLADENGDPVANQTLRFAAPASGASAVFSNGSAALQLRTDAQGLASSGAITANAVVGAYQVLASVDGVSTPASFDLRNSDAATPILTLLRVAGDGQTAQVGQAFAQRLQAKVVDAQGAAVAGQVLVFTLPSASAGTATASFAGGSRTASVATDAQGLAISPLLTANAVEGRYQANAAAASVSGEATFSLTNTAQPVHVLQLLGVSGSGQSAHVGTAFAQALQVKLVDDQGLGVANHSIRFELPSGGASARFAGGALQAEVQTDADGFASAPLLTANSTEGSYEVLASAAGVADALLFALTNTAATAPVLNLQVLAGGGQSAVVDTAFAEVIRVKLVNGQGEPVAGRVLSFSMPASGAAAVFAGGGLTTQATTDAQGLAASLMFTANPTVGDYEVVVTTPGAPDVRLGLKNTPAPAGDKQVTIPTPTGTGTLKAWVTGGGASCHFNPDKTAVKRAQGWLPLFDVLLFPHGVFEYELIGCDVGSTVTITTEWPNLFGVSNYMKYGPTPTSRGRSLWYVPKNLKLEGNRVSFTITDGQLGDDDLVANGVIKDPGGPVIQSGPLPADEQVVPVPGLGWLAVLMLSLLTGLMALVGVRRKRLLGASNGR
ncbi:choice-of-anchor U domain-containing protein [Comamonas sp. JUb58]|uniref:choice-of-anchor U domain-containing protein n=1 Tax=Comamonas sp. JUb58 TaxID=2485114 RepID=UPI00106201FA|nr:choice-of-anchor U domain-containing protein [Comamonas sp. JUb58]TDS84591.1 putative repeat protein (TIGR01451 family) [Comamonas sp. JUb58]